MMGGARLRPDGLRRGKSCDTPGVCFSAVWYGSGEKLPFVNGHTLRLVCKSAASPEGKAA